MLGNKNVKCKLIYSIRRSSFPLTCPVSSLVFTSSRPKTRDRCGEEKRGRIEKRRMKELCNEEARCLDAKEKGGKFLLVGSPFLYGKRKCVPGRPLSFPHGAIHRAVLPIGPRCVCTRSTVCPAAVTHRRTTADRCRR